jgi:hypothetical protein
MSAKEKIRSAISALQAQRVRQDNVMPVLDCVIAQAYALAADPEVPALREAGLRMKERAFALRGIASSVPRFAVEDLLAESIARLNELTCAD